MLAGAAAGALVGVGLGYLAESAYGAIASVGGIATIAAKQAASKSSTAVNVTEDVIRKAVKNAPLKTQQDSVSLPVIKRYVERLQNGEIPPAIKIDKGIIVDGNHRYIASRIAGVKIGQIEWLGGRLDKAKTWSKYLFLQLIGEIDEKEC